MFRGLSCACALALAVALSPRALGDGYTYVYEHFDYGSEHWTSIELGAAVSWPQNSDVYTGPNGAPIVEPIVASYIGKDWGGDAMYRAELLANATDPEGDPLRASVEYPAARMNAKRSADGKAVIFTLRGDVSITSDVFRYAVTDGTRVSRSTLRFDDRPPTGPDTITFELDKSWPWDVERFSTDPDGDTLKVVKLITRPRWNDVTVWDTGAMSFGLRGQWVGEDSFAVLISDGRGGTRVQNVVVKAGLTFAGGAHTALLQDDYGPWFGALRVSFLGAGRATVVLFAGGKRYPAKVDFNATHSVTFANGVNVSFEPYRLAATVYWRGRSLDAQLVPDLDGPELEGQYNIIIERPSSAAMHYGFAVARIDRGGHARISGRMPDGVPWSTGAAVDENSLIPMVAGTGSQSSTTGPLFVEHPDSVNAVHGGLTWRRGGSIEELNVGGGRYVRNSSGLNVFSGTHTVATLALSSAGRAALVNEVTLNGADVATFTKKVVPGLQMTVNPATGVFSGYTILALPKDANPMDGDAFLAALRAAVTPFSGVIRGDTGFGVLGLGPKAGSVALLPHFAHLFENYGLSWQGSAASGGVVVTGGFEETAIGVGSFTPVPSN